MVAVARWFPFTSCTCTVLAWSTVSCVRSGPITSRIITSGSGTHVATAFNFAW